MPTRRRNHNGSIPAMSLPQNDTRPLVGISSRLHNRSSVDLPEPDGPNTTVTPCCGTAAVKPSSARIPPRSTTTSTKSNTESVVATALADQHSEPRLDHLVDDRQPFVERNERRLHRVDGEPLEVTPAIAESFYQPVHFAAHRRVAHQPVIGVDGHPEP